MAWRVDFAKGAQKDLTKLDASGRDRVLRFLAERVAQVTTRESSERR
jgi:mRNA-degrading endonuclease RelE of RelBE toxin-antitoxin system